jgi:hypothetical protein
MKKLIIVDASKEQSMLIRLSLANFKDVKVYEKTSIHDVIDLVEIIEDVDAIYCTEDNKDNLQLLANYLNVDKGQIRLILNSTKSIEYPSLVYCPIESSIDKIIEIIKHELALATQVDLSSKEYIAIPTDYFLYFKENPICADIYLKIKKAEESDHYIKRVQKGEVFEGSEVLRFKEMQVENFYIKSDQYLEFVESARRLILSTLISNDFSPEKLIEISHSSYRVTQSMILELGIDNHTYELVKTSIETMDKVVEDGELKLFLDKLKSNPESFIYNHVYLLSFLLNKVVANFSWATTSIKEKITYVAFFHDLSIQSDHLAIIHSEEELASSSLTTLEKKLVINHANESAKIIEKFNYLPMGVANVVREHHGAKFGNGFTSILNSKIAPLSMVFIVIEDFVQRYLKLTDTNLESINVILQQMEDRFNKGTYQETVTILKNIILKKSI